MATIIPVANETNSQSSRMTKEGKKITYRMQVIQQPERARACGSGAKSSADRRPVDPPPIVELRVFEGEGNNMTEVTISYSANFFLFATLENARQVAQGRVSAASTQFAVLTGTPVAGMAYLDRPTPAGYFIFPDLSVRHEGKYRLSFALYEELKDAKDMDAEDRGTVPPPQVDAHVSHRLEVKSSPFTVFSAKKFPGLTESTALSRMVAEQGCRVRIRRDVRMRRRENKSSKDWDEYDEEAGYDATRRTATPDAYGQQNMATPQPLIDAGDRPRSVSNASNASFAPPARRPSLQDMAQGYQQNSFPHMATPQPQNNGYPPPMQYGGAPSQQYQNQYAPPQQSSMMQPPQTPYQHQSHQPHHSYPSQPAMHMPQPYGYPSQSYSQPHYEQPAPMRQESTDYSGTPTEYRRPSMTATTTQQYAAPNPMVPFGTLDSTYNRPQLTPTPSNQPIQSSHHGPPATPGAIHMPNGHSLPHIKTLQTLQPPAERVEPVSPSYQLSGGPMSGGPLSGGPLSAPGSMSASSDHGYPPKFASQPQSAAGTKRSFSSTFDTKHLDARLQHGERPNITAPPYGYDNNDDSPDIEEIDENAMMYRRADGTHRQRRVPDLA
ncbi:uncharacterized protein BDZ99DRAFT_279359 [Mytilinidion resinicola]|uniref:Velvet domain-containing protein n=1 Tax=Mytilinidion resinicola TaxID=574789 RepID=A0A6A6YRY7_9PEZI|nr:uncharacterized protein BDZ99DRAFT_279359 [Mytilinidion resinicola]KAF2811692.1 hypothetical protein BDZ99DRAFT_279359 [Mytilinidion resinicola]